MENNEMHNEIMIKFAQQEKQLERGLFIQGFRKEAAISIRELGRITGLSSSYISKLEKGCSAPTVETIDKLSIAFGEDFKRVFYKEKENYALEELVLEETYKLAGKAATKTEKQILSELIITLSNFLLCADDTEDEQFLKLIITISKKLKKTNKDR